MSLVKSTREKFMEFVKAEGGITSSVNLELKTMSGGANTGSNLLRLLVNPGFRFITENEYKNGISTYYNLYGDNNGINNGKVSLSRFLEEKNDLTLNACYSKSSNNSINSVKITDCVIENGIGSYFFDNRAQEDAKITDFNVNYGIGIGCIKIGISSLITNNNISDTLINNSKLISNDKDEILGIFYTLGYSKRIINRVPFLYGISYDLGKIDSNTTAIGNRIDLTSWNFFLKRNYNNNIESTLSYRLGDIDYVVAGKESSFYKIGLLLNVGENINLGYSKYKSSNRVTPNTKIRTIFVGFDTKGLNLELKSQDLSNINNNGNKDVLSLSSSFSF